MPIDNFCPTFFDIPASYCGRFRILWDPDPAFFEPVAKTTRQLKLPQPRHPGDLLAVCEAANFLGLSAKTLANWRVTGSGPKFVKLGGRVGYRMTDLENFIIQNLKASTSDGGHSHV